MPANEGNNFNTYSAILIFVAFFVVIIFIAVIKKIFYYFKYKKRYYVIPRPSVLGIAYIAMVISLSVAVLLILTFVTANGFSVLFRSFPGTRITIEGILIKIGGVLFGPFIGMLIGALTDLLSIILTAGVFHYGYFIAAIAYGLLSGLITVIFKYTKQKQIWYAVFATVVALVSYGLVNAFIQIYFGNQNSVIQSIFPFIPSVISLDALFIAFSIFTFFALLIIWILFFISIQYNKAKKNKLTHKQIIFKTTRKKKKKKQYNYFNNFCLVLILAIVSEALINVLLMPSFDSDLSTLNYDNWFVIRLVLFVPMVWFNFVIIYPVYVVVSPIVKWDYTKESSENYNLPYYIS